MTVSHRYIVRDGVRQALASMFEGADAERWSARRWRRGGGRSGWLDRSLPALPHHNPPRFRAGVLAALQHLHSVDEYVDDASRELHRLLVGRLGADGRGIENHDVSEVARGEEAAVGDAEVP